MANSKFGQFADPNFGKSLYQQPAGGDPNRSASGSNSVTGTVTKPGVTYLEEGGAIPEEEIFEGEAAPEEFQGEAEPEPFQGEAPPKADADPFESDTGHSASPVDNGMDVLKKALVYGRKKMGLPPKFFGHDDMTRGEAVNEAARDEGAGQGITDPKLKEFQANQVMNSLQPGETAAWGKYTTPPKQADTQWLAEGGAVEGDDDETGGMIPEEEGSFEQQSSGTSGMGQKPDQMMGYLTGAGGVDPQIAQGLEQQADPTGRMDPNLRKMLAVRAAGSPDKAWGVLQHYRGKFNAYNSFAQAAARGVQGKPADLAASARAATQAYENLPDGNAVSFRPHGGGVEVTMQRLNMPQAQPQFQNNGTDFNSVTRVDPGQITRNDPSGHNIARFEDGGAVEEEVPMIPEDPGAGGEVLNPEDTMPQQSLGALPEEVPTELAGQDWARRRDELAGRMERGVDSFLAPLAPTEGEKEVYGQAASAVGGVAKDFWDRQNWESVKRPARWVMSIPQYLGLLKEHGQPDSVWDNGFENQVIKAMKTAATSPMAPGAPGTFKPPMPGQQPTQDPADEATGDPASQFQGTNRAHDPKAGLSDLAVMPQSAPGVPDMPGARKPQYGGERSGADWQPTGGESLPDDIRRAINEQFPYVGQNTQRMAAMRDALEKMHERKRHTDVAGITANSRTESARTNAEARAVTAQNLQSTKVYIEHLKDKLKRELSENNIEAKNTRAALDRASQEMRGYERDMQANYRAGVIATGPAAVKTPEKAQAIRNNVNQGAPARPAPSPLQHKPQAGTKPAAPGATAQGGSAPALPTEAVSKLKEGRETTFGNGQVWTLQGGKPVQVR